MNFIKYEYIIIEFMKNNNIIKAKSISVIYKLGHFYFFVYEQELSNQLSSGISEYEGNFINRRIIKKVVISYD